MISAPNFARLNCRYSEEPAASVATALPLVPDNLNFSYKLQIIQKHTHRMFEIIILSNHNRGVRSYEEP